MRSRSPKLAEVSSPESTKLDALGRLAFSVSDVVVFRHDQFVIPLQRIDHIPNRERVGVTSGGQFIDFNDSVAEFARLFGLRSFDEVGWLSARGIRFEGQLSAILVLYETRKIFGTS